jgi:hypothetical protein
MYLPAYVDKGFSGRGFISPPAFGWVESYTLQIPGEEEEFHQPSRLWVG